MKYITFIIENIVFYINYFKNTVFNKKNILKYIKIHNYIEKTKNKM